MKPQNPKKNAATEYEIKEINDEVSKDDLAFLIPYAEEEENTKTSKRISSTTNFEITSLEVQKHLFKRVIFFKSQSRKCWGGSHLLRKSVPNTI